MGADEGNPSSRVHHLSGELDGEEGVARRHESVFGMEEERKGKLSAMDDREKTEPERREVEELCRMSVFFFN